MQTLGYAETNFILDNGNQQYFRISTVNESGNKLAKFLSEIKDFVYGIEIQSPLILNVQYRVYVLDGNEIIDQYIKYVTICDHVSSLKGNTFITS